MVLGYRGSGKTTVLLVCYAIFLILQDPNVRILIGSRSGVNAERIATDIRRHFESCEALIRIFGDYRGDKWDATEFWVKPRTSLRREGTVSIVGLEGAIVSRHYDVELLDDAVDEETARTRGMREKLDTFYYKSLLPCLEPDGELHLTGTRYHPKELYSSQMAEGEMTGDRTLIVPALLGDAESGYTSQDPEKFPVEYLLALRRGNRVAFEMQYQCSVALLQGKLFNAADLPVRPLTEFDDTLPRFQGLDLAGSLDPRANRFAQVIVDYDAKTDTLWVRAIRVGRHPGFEQRRRAAVLHREHECVRTGSESNAYQITFAQDFRKENPDLRIREFQSRQSKATRAERLAERAAAGKLILAPGLDALFEELVLFPDGENDDLVDALGIAEQVAMKKSFVPRDEVDLNWKVRSASSTVST